jgi:hypothetical protein
MGQIIDGVRPDGLPKRQVASWYLGKGSEEQRAIEAVFAARDAVHRRSEWYRQKFGDVPGLRAVLHRGSVVAGECGDSNSDRITIRTSAEYSPDGRPTLLRVPRADCTNLLAGLKPKYRNPASG